MFVTTANTLNILPPLLDRMEVIRLAGYTEDEKINIANKYLLPKQIKDNGVKENEMTFAEDIIKRAASSFDEVMIAVSEDNAKSSIFSVKERLKMAEIVAKKYTNVSASSFKGLTVDFAKVNATNLILRGVRDSSDFDNEAQNALMNKTLDNSIETIFLISSKNVREISSTNVRQILSLAGDVSNFMSTEIISYINSLKT
jgi:pantetheine-phosphate adenylyltransferase